MQAARAGWACGMRAASRVAARPALRASAFPSTGPGQAQGLASVRKATGGVAQGPFAAGAARGGGWARALRDCGPVGAIAIFPASRAAGVRGFRASAWVKGSEDEVPAGVEALLGEHEGLDALSEQLGGGGAGPRMSLQDHDEVPAEGQEEENPRGGAPPSGGTGDDGAALVKRDPNWVPNEVIVIPVFRRPVFPGIATPIALTNPAFCEAILKLKSSNGSYPLVGLFMAKQSSREEGNPIKSTEELHQIGCLGQVVYIHSVQQLGVQLLVAGAGRILITGTARTDPFLTVTIQKCNDKPVDPGDKMVKAWVLEIISTMKSVVKLEHSFKEQLQTALTQVDVNNPGLLADITASMTTADRESLQEVLNTLDVQDRLAQALRLLKIEFEQAELQRSIHKQMEDSVSKMQRKHFLNEQLKIIKKELGLEKDEKEDLVQSMTEKLASLNAPPHAEKVITEQLKKISMLEPSSPEFNITRTYLDWLISIPWGISTEENYELDRARKILDKDHYGMKDVKDRILEFIAVGKLKGSVQGRIICFVGPPGVGKTSIGKSIATSLNRKFFRFSVGGMTDVAEIKGHRRTYVGAMPGKCVQALKSVGSNNPVIVLDEIDKLGRGYQGDPASALLEVLDPSQNKEFLDHYLDVTIDLSQVLFICTANTLDTIPGPLRDRMEIIQVSGYTADDKVQIAKKHLLPAARVDTGIKATEINIAEGAMRALISKYCREPGVRNLQKQIEKLLRKAAYLIATNQTEKLRITEANLKDYAGRPLFPSDRIYDATPPGVVMGLAWTSMGGTSLYIESTAVGPADKGTMRCTGQMGDVMKESTEISLTLAKKMLREFVTGDKKDFLDKHHVHVHIPEGATPKDGPSAGITMTTALVSLALNTPVVQNLAMTGEVTLTGKVLPVGGIKEKVLAAQRSGVTTLILPDLNRRDWDELDDKTREGIDVNFATTYGDVFDVAFPEHAGKLKSISKILNPKRARAARSKKPEEEKEEEKEP